MDFRKLSPYEKFIHSCKSEVTKRGYTRALKRWMARYKINEYEDILKLSVKELEEIMIDHALFMKENNYSKYYFTQQMATQKRFLFMNGVVLNWDLINQYKGEFKRKQKDEAYSHEQIAKVLEICDIRTRVIVLVYASVGIRADALHGIKRKSLERIGDLYQFTIYEGCEEEYISYCTPECATAIDNYLSFRKLHGEKLNEESFLIREQFDINDLEQVRSQSRQVSTASIRSLSMEGPCQCRY